MLESEQKTTKLSPIKIFAQIPEQPNPEQEEELESQSPTRKELSQEGSELSPSKENNDLLMSSERGQSETDADQQAIQELIQNLGGVENLQEQLLHNAELKELVLSLI